jgi:hypothetical protein
MIGLLDSVLGHTGSTSHYPAHGKEMPEKPACLVVGALLGILDMAGCVGILYVSSNMR